MGDSSIDGTVADSGTDADMGDAGTDADMGDAGTDADMGDAAPPCATDMCDVCDDDVTNDCVQDCADTWGGTAVADMCGTCDDDSTNDCVEDCAGTWGGAAIADMCGTCDEDSTNDCVQDCAGDWGGTATTDPCGTCDADPTNDCTIDCAGTVSGTATEDMCGVCDTDSTNDCVQDCAGVWGGTSASDPCGTCDMDPTNDCVTDCAGVAGGSSVLDMCGTCDADATNDCVQDCAGAWGGTATVDMCGTCDADATNDCVQDCASEWGGTATVDMCGTCDADATNDCVQDCAGEWGGTAVTDACGRCTGGTSGLTACPTVRLEPVADSYVVENRAGTNYGTETTLNIVAGSRTNTSRIYMRFDLSSLPAGSVVRGVALEAHAYQGYAWGGNGNVYTRLVADDTWDETTINWTNKPAADATNLGSWWLWYNRTPSDKTGINNDPALIPVVQSEFEGDGLISFRLHSSGYDTQYRSREYATAADRPALVIGYLPSTTISITPSADAHVIESRATTNYGSDATLRIEAESRSNTSRVFMRFDLSSIPAGAEVVEASLTAHAFRGFAWGGNGNVYTRLVADDSWDEGAVNWSNQPAADTVDLGFWWLWYNSTPGDKTGTFTSDALRDAVGAENAGDDAISFRLHSPGYQTQYRSREYATTADRPTLTVRYIANP